MRSAIVAMLLLCGVLRAEPAPVEARLVGVWEMTVGARTVIFEPQAAGRYKTHAKGLPAETGAIAAADGHWRMKKDSGAVNDGTYVFAGADTVTFSSGAVSVTWHRAGTAAPLTEAEALYARAKVLLDKDHFLEALPDLTEAAKRGNAPAQQMLGFVLEEGEKGIPKDAAAAAGWFAKAAAQGNRAAQYALGGMIEEGEGGLTKDPKRAAELYEASANQGFAKAQFAFGMSCEFLFSDRKRAITYLELAGKQGEGGVRWLAQWLRRKGTPHFQNEAQLGAYVNAQIAAWMAASMPKADTSITKYYRERVQMFYSQGDTAAGDRCKYHGSCY